MADLEVKGGAPVTQIMEELYQFEQALQRMSETTMALENVISELMQENNALRQEQERLLRQSQQGHEQEEVLRPQKSSSQMMMDLYEQGFHICNEAYGKRMQAGDHCLFCEAMLERLTEGL